MKKYPTITIWLFIGCVMVLVQIAIGGITRLTDSGLSITEWEVIRGTLPPMNQDEWDIAFKKYQSIAKKQFESIHSDMTLDAFKKIYFWEYFHRLWARAMGFVFLIPFVYFLARKRFDTPLIRKLGGVIVLATIAAIFGWIMVASGLNNDKRTWVSAYNLLGHLCIALSLFSYLLYTYYQYAHEELHQRVVYSNRSLWIWIGFAFLFQFALGALVAGMKAGLTLPYPFLILKYDHIVEIFKSSDITVASLYDYEPNPVVKVLVQIAHRAMGYLIFLLSAVFIFENRAVFFRNLSLIIFSLLLIGQILLGLFTVSYSIGKIPIVFGVLHQTTAFLLFSSYLWILFTIRKK
jgi:cytochrome c oxidase assembly protein subunit 15